MKTIPNDSVLLNALATLYLGHPMSPSDGPPPFPTNLSLYDRLTIGWIFPLLKVRLHRFAPLSSPASQPPRRLHVSRALLLVAGTPHPWCRGAAAPVTHLCACAQIGWRRPIKDADVWQLQPSMECDGLATTLEAEWARRVRRGRGRPAGRLFAALLALVKRDLIICAMASAVEAASEVSRPLILKKILEEFNAESVWTPFGWTFGLLLASISIAISHSVYLQMSRNVIGLKCMSATTSVVYGKAMRSHANPPQERESDAANATGPATAAGPAAQPAPKVEDSAAVATTGDNDKSSKGSSAMEMNLVSTDAELLVEGFYWGLRCVMAFLVIVSVAVLLLFELGVAALAGFAFLGVTLGLQTVVGRAQGRTQSNSQHAADRRLQVVSEAVLGIRNIKYAGMETLFRDRITALRGDELKSIRRFRFLWAINELLAGSSGVIVAVVCISASCLP